MTRPPELPTTSGHKAGTPLREGFTTGTAATAAALAAADLLLNPGSAASAIHLASAIHPADETSETGETGAAPHLLAPHPHLLAPPPMLAPLPPFSAHGVPAGYLTIPIAQCTRLGSRSAKAAVLKDGGDDPDATHNMLIAATVCLFNSVRPGEIIITAGPGIGRATLPGLPLPVGAAAINPVPRLQIRAALTQLAAKYNYTGAFSVCLSAPEGVAVHWYADGEYLGLADTSRAIAYDLTPGAHRVLCIDAEGARDEVHFDVLTPEMLRNTE